MYCTVQRTQFYRCMSSEMMFYQVDCLFQYTLVGKKVYPQQLCWKDLSQTCSGIKYLGLGSKKFCCYFLWETSIPIIHCAKLICTNRPCMLFKQMPPDTCKISYSFRNNTFLKIPGYSACIFARTNSTQ